MFGFGPGDQQKGDSAVLPGAPVYCGHSRPPAFIDEHSRAPPFVGQPIVLASLDSFLARNGNDGACEVVYGT